MHSEPLRAVGLSEAAELCCLDLMEFGECTPAELAARASLKDGRAALALAELEAIGLARLVLEAFAARRSREAGLARESAEILSRMWLRASGRRADFELLRSHEAGCRVLDGIQRDARDRCAAPAAAPTGVRAMTLFAPRPRRVTGCPGSLRPLLRSRR
ncbi:hypothetical protein [Streptomyces sp. 351MFTsu5.1]|uniref:hypothetical protein n=1 Tax=Streptomyces sp. 351MFTsu5.1 TaxID=1172180 RepID=UPI00036E9F80|nr:hypothetical protein [Streptomyces sp. 351MFTsu5.1]